MIVFTCGGTGGHISPALTIAKHLKEPICFIGGDRLEKIMINGYQFISVPNLKRGFINIFLSVFKARKILKHLKPKFIFATGGYVTLPVGIASVTLGIPLILLEQNCIAGKTNKFLAKFAKIIFTGYPIKSLKNKKTIYSGNPVDEKIVKGEKTKMLVLGGSQGAKSINELIIKNLPELAKLKNDIIWLTGESSYQNITNTLKPYNTNKKFYTYKNIQIEVYPFSNNMPKLFANTRIAISRAGAMSVAELTQYNIPTLFIPYPYATDNHQFYNAKYIVDIQGGEMLTENEISNKIFCKTISKINDSIKSYQKALKSLPNNACSIIIDKLFEKGLIDNER